MSTWTFVTNHGAVLAFIARHHQITTREMAQNLGITERSVLRIIADLEGEGYLQRTRNGRVNRYQVDFELPLQRADIGRGTAVGDLLKLLDPATKS